MRVVMEHPAFVWDSQNPRMSPIGFADCSILARVSETGETTWHLKLADGRTEWLQDKDVICRVAHNNYIVAKGE